MTYTHRNFRTKKALKEAIANHCNITIFEPAMGEAIENGIVYLEGPHAPEPHKWYAQAIMQDGLVVKVVR